MYSLNKFVAKNENHDRLKFNSTLYYVLVQCACTVNMCILMIVV